MKKIDEKIMRKVKGSSITNKDLILSLKNYKLNLISSKYTTSQPIIFMLCLLYIFYEFDKFYL